MAIVELPARWTCQGGFMSDRTTTPANRGKGGETRQQSRDKDNTLTTQQGGPIADDQNSLKVGSRGPMLLEDHVFRDKLFHFNHERIPERVVHARGFGAHGYFESYGNLGEVSCADVFQRK